MKTKIRDNIPIPAKRKTVTLKETGNVRSIIAPMLRNEIATIIPISEEEYVHCKSGEIRKYQHHAKDRTGNLDSLRKSVSQLRDIINCNLTPETKNRTRFVTLTYKENMTDPKSLYLDTDKFNKRFRYYLRTKYSGLSYEYITAVEAQGRGAFHLHIIMIFSEPPPYIENSVLAEIWRHGFVSIKKIRGDVDDLGSYLTAYLTDLAISEENFSPDMVGKDVAVKEGKAVIKGERLKLIPVGVNLYRASRGIKRPTVLNIEYGEAIKMLETDGYSLVNRSAVRIEEPESGFSNTVVYERYKKYIRT